MSQITQLNIHDRNLQVQLNNQGKATGWVHLLDDEVDAVIEHQTALRCDRDGDTIWSGAIWQANESSSASGSGQQSGQDKLDITAMGWFNALNRRVVHTGAEFQAMLTAPSGAGWQAANGSYIPLGTDDAIQLAYSVIGNPLTTDAAIIFDLVNRANIDSPTRITTGNIFGDPIQRNLTLQRFQYVGQEITQLVNVESGVDFTIDPVTRKMDLYGPGSSASPLIPNGIGIDRGFGTLFAYPGNCISAQRTGDGTQTANRFEVTGQYAVGRADDISSQESNDLFETIDSLSEVVDPNILAAYANAEVAVRAQPWQIVSFTPRSVTASDANITGVPRPFIDFDLGDLVYTRIDRGKRFQVGTVANPQAVRVFGFTVAIDDTGTEKVQNIQTSYQGVGVG